MRGTPITQPCARTTRTHAQGLIIHHQQEKAKGTFIILSPLPPCLNHWYALPSSPLTSPTSLRRPRRWLMQVLITSTWTSWYTIPIIIPIIIPTQYSSPHSTIIITHHTMQPCKPPLSLFNTNTFNAYTCTKMLFRTQYLKYKYTILDYKSCSLIWYPLLSFPFISFC